MILDKTIIKLLILIFSRNLYVTTDSGVFVANFIQDNLISSSWTKIPFDALLVSKLLNTYIELKMDFIYPLSMNCTFVV